MEGDFKIIEFGFWCKKCKHRRKKEQDEPCASCLEVPARADSRKPEKFEDVERRKK